MTCLVLLAYGRATEHPRAIFAALSAWAWATPAEAASLRILAYTDQPAALEPWLAGLPVRYELLTPERLAEARGPQQFVHRVKVACLLDARQQYPTDALLYVDSDTFFVASPAPLLRALTANRLLLHQPEYTLPEAITIHERFGQGHYPRQLLAELTRQPYRVGEADIAFQPTQTLWNSGVVGLPAAATALLPDVLTLTDRLYAATNWFTSEQVAFSLVLPAIAPPLATNAAIYHYWRQPLKELADTLLAQALSPDLAARPLPERLGRVRQLSRRFHNQLEQHRTEQDALHALRTGQRLAGLKCATKALLRQPLHPPFLRQLAQALRGA